MHASRTSWESRTRPNFTPAQRDNYDEEWTWISRGILTTDGTDKKRILLSPYPCHSDQSLSARLVAPLRAPRATRRPRKSPRTGPVWRKGRDIVRGERIDVIGGVVTVSATIRVICRARPHLLQCRGQPSHTHDPFSPDSSGCAGDGSKPPADAPVIAGRAFPRSVRRTDSWASGETQVDRGNHEVSQPGTPLPE